MFTRDTHKPAGSEAWGEGWERGHFIETTSKPLVARRTGGATSERLVTQRTDETIPKGLVIQRDGEAIPKTHLAQRSWWDYS